MLGELRKILEHPDNIGFVRNMDQRLIMRMAREEYYEWVQSLPMKNRYLGAFSHNPKGVPGQQRQNVCSGPRKNI